MRSTNRQPSALWQPKLRRRHKTARRCTRSAWLFVGSTPSVTTKVHMARNLSNSLRAERFVLRSRLCGTGLQHRQHRERQRSHVVSQVPARATAAAKQVPQFENFFVDAQAGLGDLFGFAAALEHFFPVAFQVRPTKLAAISGPVVVGAPAVAAQNTKPDVAEQFAQGHRVAQRMNKEKYHAGRGGDPQPAFLAVFFPAGLVGVLDLGLTHRLFGFFIGRRQSGADFLFEVGHRAQRHRRVKNRFGNFFDAAFADA